MRRIRWLLFIAACGDSGDTTTPDAPAGACEATTPWASAPPLIGGPTQETAAIAVDGKIYVIGGLTPSSEVSSVQVFDIAACRWSKGPALPRAAHHANVAEVGGTIYVLGSLAGATFNATPDAWAWNPASDAGWTPRAALPAGTQRGAAVTAAIDGKIFVAGGFRSGAVNDVSIYDPVGDSWAPGPPLPEPRDHACGGAIGGKLYVAGGRQATIGSTSPKVFELTPGGGWAERAPMITARGGTACGVVGGALIVAGGEGNPASPSGVFPQVESYDGAANLWAPLTAMRTPRHGMGAAAWAGQLHVPGGATQQGLGAVDVYEILTP